MEEQVNRLVDKTWATLQTLPPSTRYLIAVAGIPGSGKTTLSTLTASRLNALHQTQNHPNYPSTPGPLLPPIAAAVPLDGFHLTRAQLSALPDPEEAHYRRGAAFTFDGQGYLELVRRLKAPICPETGTVWAPSFDHKVKDPVAEDVPVGRTVRVVLLEGNYVALNDGEGGPWRQARDEVDEVWFVEVSEEAAVERLVRRHVAAGIAKDEDSARERAWKSDMRNGREILEKLERGKVTEWVGSREDAGWRPEKGGVGKDRVEEERGEKRVDGVEGSEETRPLVGRSETMESLVSQNSIVEMAGNGVGM